MNKFDVIVIGSGISGLTSALILAKEGRRVALFERDRDIAPLIRPYQRNGCECSPGLHISGWMAEGEVISSFFKYLNIFDGIEQVLLENGFGEIIVNTKKYHFPRGFAKVEESLLAYFPKDYEAIHNYLRLIKEVNEGTFYLNHKLPHIPNNHSQFGGGDQYSLKDCLEQYHASQELIALLETFNYILMGSKAGEVPFTTHAFVIGGFYSSPGFFSTKGIKCLLANFKRELARFGVNLFIKTEISEILIDSTRKTVGVKTTTGDQYYAPTVIASFNPKLLVEKIKPNLFRPIFRRRLAEAENTFGLYVAFYKIVDEPELEIENFIYHDDGLDIDLGAAINRSDGNTVLSVFLAEKDRFIPKTTGLMGSRANENLKLMEGVVCDKFPHLRGKLELLDYLKPWSFERYTKTLNGSAYSIKHNTSMIGFQHRVPIRGLYLVGQSIYPGFLGSMISGFSLAIELLESDKFWLRVTNQ